MDLIAIGVIALAFSLYLALPGWQRKRRRQKMGLKPLSYRETWTWPRRWQ